MTGSWYFLKAAFALALIFPSLVAQGKIDSHHGIFQGSTDVGATEKGSTVYDSANGTYRVTGGGADMWGATDAFHFSWVRLSGDAAITADVQISPGAVPLAKAVLIIRQSRDPGSAYADVAIHADGHITLQYRKAPGGETADLTAPQHGSVRLQIERKGDQFTAYAQSSDGKMVAFGSMAVPLHDPVYVGLGVCSHNANGVSTATFSNVRIEKR